MNEIPAHLRQVMERSTHELPAPVVNFSPRRQINNLPAPVAPTSRTLPRCYAGGVILSQLYSAMAPGLAVETLAAAETAQDART